VKRVIDVVRIFAGVRKQMPAMLVMVGDGPERDAAQTEADGLGLKGDVRFLGKVDNVADVMRGADLFLLPSEVESFGLAALEAMACGAPVIASNTGGLPELVTDGETGCLAAPGDVSTMTERSLAVLRDPGLAARMRAAAVERAQAFSVDKVVPQYERVYQDLLRV
jgi:N-acetyl-alpha-D-glucosaminyl L-malate synthase BshA